MYKQIDSSEFIFLAKVAIISGIKMPKVRAWYYNKDNKFLKKHLYRPLKKAPHD